MWSTPLPLAHVAALCIPHLAYGKLSLLELMAKVVLNPFISAVTTNRRKPRSHRKRIYWVRHMWSDRGWNCRERDGFFLAEYCITLAAGWQVRLFWLHDEDVPSLGFNFLLTTVQRNDITVLIGQYYTLGRPFLPQPRVSLLILLYIFLHLCLEMALSLASFNSFLLTSLFQRSFGATTDNYMLQWEKLYFSIQWNPNGVKVYF